jgi:hypothetical protein
MSLSGMVEIPRLQAKRNFVMPAQAGIQVCFGEPQSRLDSGFRRNDGKEKVHFESTPTKSLGFESRVV